MTDSTTGVSRFEDKNKPQSRVQVSEVSSADIVWEVDWELRENPTPREFSRISTLEAKLLAMDLGLPDEVSEEVTAVHDALTDLREAMMDCRDLDEEQRREVSMGNIDALPEVEKRVEQ